MNAASIKHSRQGSRFGSVLVSELHVDPAAQRKLSPGWVKAHIDGFDVDQLGYITVNRRGDGKWYVVDGQHRVELMRAVGWGDQRIHAELFEGLTQRQEAALFRARNDRRAIRKIDDFRVAVTAGDRQANDISEIAAHVGLVITEQQSEGAVSAIDKLQRIYEGGGIASQREGREALSRTLTTIKLAWGTSGAGFNGALVHGIGLVQLRYNGQLDQKALVTKLAPVKGGAPGLLGSARALKDLSGRPVHHCVASLVVDLYNKGRRTAKLDDWDAHATKRPAIDERAAQE